MQFEIVVEYFAAARDLAGCAQERVELPAAEVSPAILLSTLAARHARLAPYLPRMRLIVNDELHVLPTAVRAGDSVALLPPLAGGSPYLCAVREQPLSVDEAIAAVAHPSAGGIAIFLGIVRDHAPQGAVQRLDYEAHTRLAEAEMRRIAEALTVALPGTRLCVLHRVGSLAIGEIAVVVAASAAHRAEAFQLCRSAIDRVKDSVPIWKKEWSAAGEASWVNLEPEPK